MSPALKEALGCGPSEPWGHPPAGGPASAARPQGLARPRTPGTVSSFPWPQRPAGQDRSRESTAPKTQGNVSEAENSSGNLPRDTGFEPLMCLQSLGGLREQAGILGPGRSAPSSAPWSFPGGGLPAVFTGTLAAGPQRERPELEAGHLGRLPKVHVPVGLWPQRADRDVKVADGAFFGRKGSCAAGKPTREGKHHALCASKQRDAGLQWGPHTYSLAPRAGPVPATGPSPCSLGSLP